MKINYTQEMKFSKEGRNALKQDLSDFYYVAGIKFVSAYESLKFSDSPRPNHPVIDWAEDQEKKIIVAIQGLIDAEVGCLEESKVPAMKELCLALHSSYETIHFLEDLKTRPGYKEHNESFLKQFKYS